MTSVKSMEYEMLDGSRKRLVQRVGDGGIIRRFEKTPRPVNPTDVVCPHFLELAWAWGCPYDCAWCYLKGTFRYWLNAEGRLRPRFKERGRVKRDVLAFISSDSEPEILNAGELCDSLMGERFREPFSKFIMPLFEGTKHRVLFLTKGDYVRHFLENDWQRNLILSWTLNAEPVSNRWEVGAPDLMKRLEAMRRVWEAGYEVRIRIDPEVPIDGWEEEYKHLIDEIFKVILPERITLGTLRGLASTLASVKDKSWTIYLHDQSGWGGFRQG
ncbi:MAG: radical SAM protein [Candidatus Bathyarchaeia archaeon]